MSADLVKKLDKITNNLEKNIDRLMQLLKPKK